MSVIARKKSIGWDSDEDDYWTGDLQQKGFDFNDDNDFSFYDGKEVTLVGLNDVKKKPSTSVSFLPTPDVNSTVLISTNLASFVEVEPKGNKQHFPAEKQSPKQTIKSLVLGLPYTFEQHKSKESKLELLDEAIRWHDGDAIISCVLFIKRTLKPSIFNSEMILRPRALNHYFKYLKLYKQYTSLADFLGMLGRVEELAMALYAPASASPHGQTKISNLQTFQKNYLSDPSLNFIGGLVQEQISLLQKQIVIDADDSKTETDGKNFLFRDYPRSQNLATTPVITTLYYCCFYHYNLAENILSSPLYIKNQHQLTEKQFTWTALQALTRLKLWPNVEKLFHTKSWIGGKKMRCCIGFDKVVYTLKEFQAPIEVIMTYLNLIEDFDLRVQVAKDCQYQKTVVDLLVTARDRLDLIDYRAELQRQQNRDYLYAEEALKASSIKWKN